VLWEAETVQKFDAGSHYTLQTQGRARHMYMYRIPTLCAPYTPCGPVCNLVPKTYTVGSRKQEVGDL